MYYQDFRLFLEDVFKIYENCILNHSLMLLIELSLKALTQLLEKIAHNFVEDDWQTYLAFVQSLLKKTLPIELSSMESWNRSKDLLENNHEAKCFALQTFLNKMQIIFQKYPKTISERVFLLVFRSIFRFWRNWSQFTTLWSILMRIYNWEILFGKMDFIKTKNFCQVSSDTNTKSWLSEAKSSSSCLTLTRPTSSNTLSTFILTQTFLVHNRHPERHKTPPNNLKT